MNGDGLSNRSNFIAAWKVWKFKKKNKMDDKKSKPAEPAKNPSSEEIGDENEFVQRFETLFNSEMFSDIVLRVGNHRFHAHKFMLVTSSEVFEAMLNEDRWREANQPEVALSEDEECESVFTDFLKYIYSGRVTLTTDTVLPILLLADKYSVKVLHKACVDYMSRHIVESPDTNRTLSWYHYSKMTGSQELQERCLQFILSNFGIVQKASDWLQMSLSEMIEFLSSSEVVIESEYELWKELERWLVCECNAENLEQNLREILPLVRFSMIPPKQLLEIESSPLYISHKAIFLEQLSPAYRQHSLFCDDVKSVPKSELYRNYTHKNYSLCHDITLPNYSQVTKIDSKIRCDIKVPLQFKPNSAKNEKENVPSFEIEFWPKGHFVAAMLYSTYMQRQSENTTLKINLYRKLNEDLPGLIVDITFVIYGMKKNVKYVAFTRTATHKFCSNSSKFEMTNVVPLGKLKEEKSTLLINGKFDAKLFLKIQDIVADEKKLK